MKRRGFTVIELLVVIVILVVASWLFFNEKARIDSVARDGDRKIAINAMYYSLEEVFYAQNNYYPSSIDSKILRSVDPMLFTDPYGVKIDQTDTDYRYEPTNCTTDGKCTGYTLRASMERESDYIKKNREHNQ